MEELRAYFFNNTYLQGIHSGIQSQHCTMEMFVKYRVWDDKAKVLFDWAEKHKTTIVLNGGYQSNLHELEEFLKSKDNPFPWASFRESQVALNGCLTNVGIILPKVIFASVQGDIYFNLSPWHKELVRRVSKCSLMN